MKKKKIIIGTRGSKLALWQSEWVKAELQRTYQQLEIELRIIHTTGDKILDTALSKIGDKGLFTKEIEQQLLNRSIDLAVHSLKDLPTTLPDGLHIGVITAREDPCDVLVTKNNLTLEQLPPGAIVLTSSLRRRAQILHLRSDLQVKDVRGNVQTRLRKLDESDAHALLLAGAGLIRLNLQDRISQRLDPLEFIPACGQGALAIEIRDDNKNIAELIAPLNDKNTQITTTAERTLLAELEGGCQIPIGAYAELKNDKLFLKAMVADLAGTKILKARAQGSPDAPEKLGRELAMQLLDMGGREILDEIRQEFQNNERNRSQK